MFFVSRRRDNPRLKCLSFSFFPFYIKSSSSDLPTVRDAHYSTFLIRLCRDTLLKYPNNLYFRSTP